MTVVDIFYFISSKVIFIIFKLKINSDSNSDNPIGVPELTNAAIRNLLFTCSK